MKKAGIKIGSVMLLLTLVYIGVEDWVIDKKVIGGQMVQVYDSVVDQLSAQKLTEPEENWDNVRTTAATPDNPKQHNPVIKIMSWTQKLTMIKGGWIASGTRAFARCKTPESRRCSYSHNRRDYNQSDVIMFKASIILRYNKSGDLPTYRPPHQKWLLYVRETPSTLQGHIPDHYRYVFNYTASYATTADIHNPYGLCKRLDSPSNTKDLQMTQGKTKLVTWFVSNCETQSQREKYAEELAKYIPLHIEGYCGKRLCAKNSKCASALKRKHKFYLTFENSLCIDYHTEKLWLTMNQGVVPVVYGFNDYKSLLPPKSYIDIRDFRSPKDLAQHLKEIDRNDTMYNEFFAWRRTHKCYNPYGFFGPKINCKMCQFLQDHRNEPEARIVDLHKFVGFEGNCVTPQELDKKYQFFGDVFTRNQLNVSTSVPN